MNRRTLFKSAFAVIITPTLAKLAAILPESIAVRIAPGAQLTISQIIAISYPKVIADHRMPQNQWAESAFLKELERQGAVKSLGGVVEVPLEYR